MERPFISDKITEFVEIRTFLSSIPEEDLKWHWDEEDREIEAVEKTDWMFQFDNDLPIEINKKIFIPQGIIHRVIKGSGDLKIQITKWPNRALSESEINIDSMERLQNNIF